MIDYLERLEAEVMKAARAEERRQRRAVVPMPRRPSLRALAPVAAAAMAVALLFTLMPRQVELERGPARLGPPPAAVVGSYSRGSEALIIDPDRYTLDARGAEIVGDVTGRPGYLRLSTDATGACGGLGDAEYAYRLSGGELELSVVREPCAAREAALTAGGWRRDAP